MKVGDIVKYIPDILGGEEWLGVVVGEGNNGYNPWLKVKFFCDDKERVFACSKFEKVS